jgi:hypothetical protein
MPLGCFRKKSKIEFCTELGKSILKLTWKLKACLSKKSNTVGITTPDFKLHSRDIVKSSMVLAQKQTR